MFFRLPLSARWEEHAHGEDGGPRMRVYCYRPGVGGRGSGRGRGAGTQVLHSAAVRCSAQTRPRGGPRVVGGLSYGLEAGAGESEQRGTKGGLAQGLGQHRSPVQRLHPRVPEVAPWSSQVFQQEELCGAGARLALKPPHRGYHVKPLSERSCRRS